MRTRRVSPPQTRRVSPPPCTNIPPGEGIHEASKTTCSVSSKNSLRTTARNSSQGGLLGRGGTTRKIPRHDRLDQGGTTRKKIPHDLLEQGGTKKTPNRGPLLLLLDQLSGRPRVMVVVLGGRTRGHDHVEMIRDGEIRDEESRRLNASSCRKLQEITAPALMPLQIMDQVAVQRRRSVPQQAVGNQPIVGPPIHRPGVGEARRGRWREGTPGLRSKRASRQWDGCRWGGRNTPAREPRPSCSRPCRWRGCAK